MGRVRGIVIISGSPSPLGWLPLYEGSVGEEASTLSERNLAQPLPTLDPQDMRLRA